MGAWFDSIHIKTENRDAVREALGQAAKQSRIKFLLGPPVRGWISVFPSDSGREELVSAQIARALPQAIFHLSVHDDDDFVYHFYREGRLIDRYNSDPDSFEEASEEEKQQCLGHPELFQDLIPKPESFAKLKTLLAGKSLPLSPNAWRNL